MRGPELTVVSSFNPSRSSFFPGGTVSDDSTIVEQIVFDTMAEEYPSVPLKVQELFALLINAFFRSGAVVGAGAGARFANALVIVMVLISTDNRCNIL